MNAKAVLPILLLATSAFAQQTPAPLPAACGPAHTTFDADEQTNSPAPKPPEAGKALVFFIQDDGPGGSYQHYTIKLGLDGTWAGAYKHNSYFAAQVDPGERHVCANVQSSSVAGQILALAHFTAEAGKTYYFRTRLIFSSAAADFYLDLTQPDSDEASYLIATYPASTWKAKK
jgi:Protein of unknown function (DUF2846)